MSIANIPNGSKIISSTHNDNYAYLLEQVELLKTRANQLETDKATKDEIIRQADLLASNIINDTVGVDGYAVDNALLGLRQRIDNLDVLGINANIALYDMEDLSNVNNYVSTQYDMTVFKGFTVALYVDNVNTTISTLDVGDVNGAIPIKIIEETGTKRDVYAGEIYAWNIMQYDGDSWVLLDKTMNISNKIGDRTQLTTDDRATIVSAINELNTNKAEKSETYTRVEIDAKDSDLAGVGRTNQTIKNNSDKIETHKASTGNPHNTTATQVGAYSKPEMQISGQSELHWDNLTNVPNLADSSWKPAVSTYDDLPVTNNLLNDMRVVADDATSPENTDTGGVAIYTCIATEGTISEQWDKLADLDWTNDHGALVGLSDDDHTQYLRHDGTRALSGNLDYNGNQAVNMVLQNSSTLPLDVEGLIYYDDVTKQLKLNTLAGIDIINGAGAIIREVEITATSGQTVFDVGQSGSYSYVENTGVINVYKKNTDGYYELLDRDDYVETDGRTITLNSPASLNDEFFFKWHKNIANILSALEPETITNTMLATDIKVGSLASLNTALKDNLVNAINETLASVRTNEQIQDVVGDLIIGGTNITTTYNDPLNTLDISLSLTDTEVLNKIKNVDGATSGLDADLLDGNEASAFSFDGHTHILDNITDSGDLAGINTNASTSNFLRGDGTWVTPPDNNTTYTAGTGLTLAGTIFNIDNPFNPDGTYLGLRAQATTKADVGLGDVDNYSKLYYDTVYAPISHGHNYVPLSGGNMTGSLSINGNRVLDVSDISLTVQAYNADTVIDASYVHTDNNYTTNEKDKLASIEWDANNLSSAGIIDNFPTVVDNLNGTFDVGASSVALYDNPNHQGFLTRYSITAQQNLATPVSNSFYVIADYNSGNPIYRVTEVVDEINESSIIPILTVYQESDQTLHFIEWDTLGSGLSNKIHKRLVKTERFGYESGLVIGETNTPVERTITITNGTVWIGAVEKNQPSFNSSTDDLHLWYKTGGVWTKSIVTQYNNSQYQGISDLQTAGSNKYVVNWIYKDFDVNSEADLVLGTGEYNSIELATAETPPTDLPDYFEVNSFLIGRIIVESGATTSDSIESSFGQDFVAVPVTDHNQLSNLQGGIAGQYYHLTGAEAAKLDGIETNATADQTKADIDALNIDADTVDGQHASEFASAIHGHIIGDITGLQGALDDKSDIGHMHVESDITDLQDYELASNKGIASGYAGLDANAKIPLSQLPDVAKSKTSVLLSTDPRPTSPIEGDKVFETNTGDSYIYNGVAWELMADADWENVNLDWANVINKPDPTITLNGDVSGSTTLTDLGNGTISVTVVDDSHNHIIGNVDGLQTVLDGKSDTTHNHTGVYEPADATILKDADIGVTVQSYNLNTVVDSAYVHTDNNYTTIEKDKLAGIADNANNYTHPIHDGDDISVDTTPLSGVTVISDLDFNVTTDTSGHVTDANGTFATRSLTLGDFGINATSTELNYVDGVTSAIQTQLNGKAGLASPAFTGLPTAPTAVAGTGTTQIATTAFVQSEMATSGTGDMLKSIYDTNDSGVVDYAEVANLVDWGNISSKPTTFTPSTHTHDYLPLAGGVLTGDLTVNGVISANTFKANDNATTDWSQFIRSSSADAAVLYINQVSSGRIAGFSSGIATAGANIVASIENDGTFESVSGGFRTGDWTMKQNADGSLGFFTV